ncbi:MAG TPA: Gfo/Idh/MocA family oxidoreductase [Gemmatimonadaceae bacterium]|jgi:predicted dehydrogenase|nr:Gfo/Idh/MocA family oxidoreductase [Gemmatimonadaceae bacterium]
MPPLRIGLLGCGQIARAVHLPVLRVLPNVRLAAIADANDAALAAAAELVPHAARFADFHALIGSGDLDAVVICLPPHLHAPSAIAAFEAGLHVYLEKPLAPSAADGARVLDAWRRAGTIGMIGFNFRFHPQAERIRQRVRAGEIGTVLGIRSVFSILPHQIPEWKRTRALGGGVLLDLASHHVDLVHHLLGDPVVRAYASVRSLQAECDHAALQLELASGASMQAFVSLGTVDEHRLELLGTSGKLVMDRTELTRPEHVAATLRGARVRRVRRALEALEPARLLRSPGAEPSFATALGVFAAAAAGGPFAGPDLIDGARCLAVVEAAERAASTGTAVVPAWTEPATGPSTNQPAAR